MIESCNLEWSPERVVQTRHGPRKLRTANPNDAFWSLYNLDKTKLSDIGVSVSKFAGSYKVNQWSIGGEFKDFSTKFLEVAKSDWAKFINQYDHYLREDKKDIPFTIFCFYIKGRHPNKEYILGEVLGKIYYDSIRNPVHYITENPTSTKRTEFEMKYGCKFH